MDDEAKNAIEYLESESYLKEQYQTFRDERPYMVYETRGGLLQFKDDPCPALHDDESTCACLGPRPGALVSQPWTEADEDAWLAGKLGTGENMRAASMPYRMYRKFSDMWRENQGANTLIK